MYGMGLFQDWVDDPDIDNVIVHGSATVVIERADGKVTAAASPFDSDEDLEAEVRALAARRGRTERRFDWANPRLDMRLPEGSRLTAIASVASRLTVVLRRHRLWAATLDDLVKAGTLDLALAALCSAAVAARLNVLVAGGTNVGKTTLLRALLAEVPDHEHVVTIETSLELGLEELGHANTTALEAREANAEGEGAIGVRTLVEWSARLNPDRLVVGEVLGEEAAAMLRALASGAEGSMTTLHARRPDAVGRRLASYVAASGRPMAPADTMDLIVDAIDLVVFVSFATDARGRRRRVVSAVTEVVESTGAGLRTSELFGPGPDGRARPTGLRPVYAAELAGAGFDLDLLDNPQGWWTT